jgi:DNA helicase HerA-like ATPase
MNEKPAPDESQDEEDVLTHQEDQSLSDNDKPVQEEKEMDQIHDFSFKAYDEKICILGASGSGKSYLANNLLQNFHGLTVFVWDINQQFNDSRSMLFHNLDDMIETVKEAGFHSVKCILQSHDNSEKEFRRFCKYAFNRGNCVVIIDEVHNYCTKQKLIKEYNDIILSGRPRGISVISISSRPASLPNNVLSNCKHCFAFKLNLESDGKFLESYMGTEVWQLFPLDKRLKAKDLPELEDHSFYYRNMDTDHGVIGKI